MKSNSFIWKKALPIDINGNLLNGAHRLASAAAAKKKVKIHQQNKETKDFTWRFFTKQKLRQDIMDYGTLNFVLLNENAYIVNLFPCADQTKDSEVERILLKYGKLYYKKTIADLPFNAYVNINMLCYNMNEKENGWFGKGKDNFQGLQKNAKNKSNGKSPLRVYVFICKKLEDVKAAKAEIRALYDKGNRSCHINDYHHEAITLAQTYFNENSLDFIRYHPFSGNIKFNQTVDMFKKHVEELGCNIQNFILVGSTPLAAYQIRDAKDIDFLAKTNALATSAKTDMFHSHDSQLKFYPTGKTQLIENPNNYFWHRGVKILSLKNTLAMKTTRNEIGKDDIDCESIRKLYNMEAQNGK